MVIKISAKNSFSKLTQKIHAAKAERIIRSANIKPQVLEEVKIITDPTIDHFESSTIINSLSMFKANCNDVNENTTIEEIIKIKKSYDRIMDKNRKENNLLRTVKEVEAIADELTQSNYEPSKRIGNILYGKILRTYEEAARPEKVIEVTDKCMPWFNEKKDYLHLRSRLNAKSFAYEKLDNKKKHYETLKEEFKLLKYISINYEDAKNNFLSLEKRPAPLNSIYKELCVVSRKLAEMTAHKKRNKAIQYLIEWKKCALKIGSKDLRPITNRIRNIKESPSRNKLQKCSLCDIKEAEIAKERRRLDKTKATPLTLSNYKKTKKVFDKRCKNSN